MSKLRKGDTVISNHHMATFGGAGAAWRAGRRATIVRLSQGDPHWCVVRFEGVGYETTVPRRALELPTVLDKLAEL